MSQQQKTYVIEVTDEQLRTISQALDFWARVQIGQTDEISQMFRWRILSQKGEDASDFVLNKIEDLCQELHSLAFPELDSPYSYHSINSPEVPPQVRIAVEMIQKFRRELGQDL